MSYWLVSVIFACVFVIFPYGVLGQVWYLIVSIPEMCLLLYFKNRHTYHRIITMLLPLLNVLINCYELNRKICFTRICLDFVYAQLQISYQSNGAVGWSAVYDC